MERSSQKGINEYQLLWTPEIYQLQPSTFLQFTFRTLIAALVLQKLKRKVWLILFLFS